MKQKLLEKYYGYKILKKEQNEIIDLILQKKDCIGVLPTGFGKSVTFQIPALMIDGVTLVITPLISLMQDQAFNLKNKGIKAEFINSSLDIKAQESIYKSLINGNIKILYVSAERLLNKYFKEIIKKVKVSLIVCDEAHTLLWSEDFRIALAHIPDFISYLGYRPVHLALTATATLNTLTKIKKYLNLSNPNIVIGNCDRDNIFFRVIKNQNKLNSLIQYTSKYNDELGIIYCLTIKSCNYVYDYLKSFGFNVGIYHGAMDSDEKKKAQMCFTNGIIKIMVSTNAFGMGIDIPNIRYIILYEMPICIEDYIQQIGRASRDGKYAEAILLYDTNDIKTLNYFIENIEPNDRSNNEIRKIKNDKYLKLDKMIEFGLTNKCLHQFVANYFNQKHKGKCMMCSNCKKIGI